MLYNYYYKSPLTLDEFYIYVQAELTRFHIAYSAKAETNPVDYPLLLRNYEEWREQFESWLFDRGMTFDPNEQS